MEVDRYVLLSRECFTRQDLHGNIIHFIIELRNETDWKVSAKLRIEGITVETETLEGLVFVQVIPDLIISVLAAHLHTELHL